MKKVIFVFSILFLVMGAFKASCFAQQYGYANNYTYDQQGTQNQYQNYRNASSQQEVVNPYQNMYINSNNTDRYIINPFGSIRWDDSVLEVIEKLKRMQGIENVKIGGKYPILYNQSPSAVLNTYFINNTKVVHYNFNPLTGKEGKITLRPYKNLIDARGNKKKYFDTGVVITASPIIIEGTPFELSASFISNKGVVINKSKNVYQDSTGYIYPLILSNIELTSKSNALKTTHNLIYQICRNKFPQIIEEELKWEPPSVDFKTGESIRPAIKPTVDISNNFDINIKDKAQSSFSFSYNEVNMGDFIPQYGLSMTYSKDRSYFEYLNKLYEDYVSNIEAQKYKSTPSLGSEI